MAINVAIIGAGSIGFTRKLVQDILCVPELKDTRFALMDINERNLDMVAQLIERDVRANKLPAVITRTTNQRDAIRGANYVFSVVRVGGLEAFETDIDIPLKYGVDQCVGDTLAPGGIMYAQRTIPVLLSICKDIREVGAPGAIFISHSNPMAMNTWACNKYGGVKTIGLCHGVTGGKHLISKALGIPEKEIDFVCAGINHQTWYIQIKHKGVDMTGKLLAAMEADPVIREREKVRIDVLRRFGYFSTESNGHLSEYVPWYRKRPDEIKNWISFDSWILGETGGYLRVCREGRNWFETDFDNWLKEKPPVISPEKRGFEHGSYIIESLETGRLYRGHFNMVNTGIITNLPSDSIVEVPVYVDGNGFNVPVVGDLPLACAATCNASISVQRMSVEAAIRGDVTLLKQAMLHDPLTGAVCNPPEIWQMADEMLVAQAKWLPQYKKEDIKAAKKRLATEPRLGTKSTVGAARVKEKTVEEMRKNAAAAKANAAAAMKENAK